MSVLHRERVRKRFFTHERQVAVDGFRGKLGSPQAWALSRSSSATTTADTGATNRPISWTGKAIAASTSVSTRRPTRSLDTPPCYLDAPCAKGRASSTSGRPERYLALLCCAPNAGEMVACQATSESCFSLRDVGMAFPVPGPFRCRGAERDGAGARNPSHRSTESPEPRSTDSPSSHSSHQSRLSSPRRPLPRAHNSRERSEPADPPDPVHFHP